MATYYKVTDKDGNSVWGGNLQWPLPTPNPDGTYTPGEWVQVEGELIECKNGLHVCDYDQMWQAWFKWGSAVWEVEVDESLPTLQAGDKLVCTRARLLKPAEKPAWVVECEGFIEWIPSVTFFKPQADFVPPENWRVFETRKDADAYAGSAAAAYAYAYAAAYAYAGSAAAAYAYAYAAATDATTDDAYAAYAARMKIFAIIARERLATNHRELINMIWEVYESGYGFYAATDDYLYVYKKA